MRSSTKVYVSDNVSDLQLASAAFLDARSFSVSKSVCLFVTLALAGCY